MLFNCLSFFIFDQILNYLSVNIIITKNHCKKNMKISYNASFNFFVFNGVFIISLKNLFIPD